jgi:glycosyltransferase involved in cell wall biosynthesis
MRIALYEPANLTGDPYPFGDSRVTELLAVALGRSGYQVDRVAATPDAAPAQSGEGIAVEREIERTVAAFASSARPRPDVWISSRIDHRSADRMGRAVCAALGIPHVLIQPRIGRAGDPAGEPAIPLQAIAAANATFVLSGTDASAITERLPSHADRVVVLPPFIDFDAALPAVNNRHAHRALLAVKLQLPTDVPWIIAAGPMATDRDLDSYRFLVQAMMPMGTLGWRLIVAGAGPRYTEVLGLLARIPGRNHRMLTIDTPADLLALLASGDLFVAPSIDESLPLAAIESQSVGVPVVAGRSAEMQKVVADSRTGMLTKPGNVPSFGNAVSFLLRHPEFRRTYAEQGPRWVARNFDMRLVVSQLDATLHRAVRLANSDRPAQPIRPVD